MRTRPSPRIQSSRRTLAFTLIEILIAIGILSLVIAAIYSSWTAILRSTKVGLDAAASVQRSRIVLRVLEDSLSSAETFALNPRYYGFVAENGDEASLSFVARLSKTFPRSGRFGDLDVRRVMFAVDQNRQLVLRQTPLVMEFDIDEKEHPIVLAKNVREFSMMFWESRRREWIDEWKNTNQLPRLIQFTLSLADNPYSKVGHEQISRIISIPATGVQPGWQMPRLPMVPGQVPPPGAVPPGSPPPGSAQ